MVSSVLTNEGSVDTIMEKVRKYDIKYIRLIVIDPNGSPRAMLIPEYQMRDSLENGVAFDGSSAGPNPKVGWQTPWDKAVIVALDKNTGKVRWEGKRGSSRIAHVTPQIFRENGIDRLVSSAGVRLMLSERSSAATPATWGAAIDVP